MSRDVYQERPRSMGFALKRTCAECPWRKDVATGRFPPERFEALRATVGACDAQRPIFACHKSSENEPQACVGYLLVEGMANLNVRMLGSKAGATPDALSAAGPLYASFEEMARANGCEPRTELTHEQLKLVRMRAWLAGKDPAEAERDAVAASLRRR